MLFDFDKAIFFYALMVDGHCYIAYHLNYFFCDSLYEVFLVVIEPSLFWGYTIAE